MADDYYAQIAAAAASGGGTYINDGRYKFMIEKLFRKDSNFAGGGTSFIAEFRVLDAEPDPSNPTVKPNPVGSTCSVVAVVSKHASAFGNIKALLLGALGALGFTEEEITPEIIVKAFNSDELRGIMLEDATYRKNIKSGANAGKPITLHKWTSIPQTEAQIAEQRAGLDAGKYSVKTNVVATTEHTAPAPTPTKASGSLLRRT